MLRSFPDSLGIPRKIVLNAPPEGIPMIFRIKESISKLFMSQEAKDALEAAGIKDYAFEPVEVSSF